jgi:DNA-binding CsgD family transcriptional regulator
LAVLKLTPRERQLCELLCQGCDVAEMAKIAGMAPRTVKVHFSRMYARNGITDGIRRVKLAVLFYREQNGWE